MDRKPLEARPTIARFGAAWLLLSLLAACQTISPAPDRLVDQLEACASPEDQARLEAAEAALAQGQFEPALQAARDLLPVNPGCARLPIVARRAVSLLPAGERAKVAREFRELMTGALAAAEDPVHRANLDFGLSLFARSAKARRKWLENALAESSKHYYALCKYGEYLWKRGDLETARERLTQAVSLRRSLAEGWLLLAQVAEDRGLYRTADKHYATYLGLRPLDRQARANHARLLVYQLRDPDRAEKILDRLWRDDPTNVEVGLHRGLVYFLQKRWKAAEAVYFDLLRRNPREARVVLSLGNLYHSGTMDSKRALQAYRYLLQLPASSDLQAGLNQALFVPTRIKEIERTLQDRGIPLPAPPHSVEDLIEA